MLVISQTTTLLQIFYELLLYSLVIFRSIRIADDTIQRNSEFEWVKINNSFKIFHGHALV